MSDTFAFSTVDSLRHADPLVINPPMITNDGHIHKIAHGNRQVPIVGRLRTPYIDISVDELMNDPYMRPIRSVDVEHPRVYADDFNDAFAALAGPECQQAVTLLIQAEVDPSIPAEEITFAEYTLVRYRSRFAVAAAAIAQRRIIEQAQAAPEANPDCPWSGLWDELTEQEKTVLATNAQVPYTDSGAVLGEIPQGIPIDWDFAIDLGITDRPLIGKRGSWSAPVPLVVCEHDYWPLGQTMPIVEQHRVHNSTAGKTVTYTQGITVKTIRVEDSQDFFDDLEKLGLITVDVRPPSDFDDHIRDVGHEIFSTSMSEESI